MSYENIGKSFINGERVSSGEKLLESYNASNNKPNGYKFYQSTVAEVDQAVNSAYNALNDYSSLSLETRATFLETLGQEIGLLGDDFIEVVCNETGLEQGRIRGEKQRVINQLNLFASTVRLGKFLDVRIDTGDETRTPLPKPDLRLCKLPLGVIGVFGASNFPLAFSTLGGDTVSALAAGCPVVFKAHSGHMATAEIIASCIQKVISKLKLPKGTFNMIFGARVGKDLVQHPLVKGIGFTGSYEGGVSLIEYANNRKEPIPVFAEMSSINPIFIFDKKLENSLDQIADGIFNSVTGSCGQLCTKPGVIIGIKGPLFDKLKDKLTEQTKLGKSNVLLNNSTLSSFNRSLDNAIITQGITVLSSSNTDDLNKAQTTLLSANKDLLIKDSDILEKEIFGPATILIEVDNTHEMRLGLSKLAGQLTVSFFGEEEELIKNNELINFATEKAGRILINNFPTGVEVSHSIVHGGPFPATSDPRGTSVGSLSIDRFLKPVCFQNFPESLLPNFVGNNNLENIPRLINGKYEPEG